ncbi:MAG: peptidoglycan-binding domain-containing protein [Cuspidothrix sp.]
MKVNLIANIPKSTRLNFWCSLLLLATTPVFISTWAITSGATPTEVKINRPTLNLGSKGERVTELQAALKLLGFYGGTVDGTYQESTAFAVSQFQQAAGLKPNGTVDNITWQKLFPTPSTINSSPSNTVSTFNTVPTSEKKNPGVSGSVPKPTKPTNSKNQPNTGIQPTPVNQQIPGIRYTPEGWPILERGMSGPEVIKLQKQLQNLGFLTGKIDGDFGKSTEIAVKDAQVRYGLKPDGIVGRSTWKAFVKRTSKER